MATPTTAGLTSLVRQYLVEGGYEKTSLTPLGSLLRAMVTHSGQALSGMLDMTGSLEDIDYPGNEQGYGRVELDEILMEAGDETTNLFLMGSYDESENANEYVSFSSSDDAAHTFTIIPTSSTNDIRVTLAWTDPVPYSGATNLMVNDLDLSITTLEGETLYPSSTGGTSKDSVNTLEMVDVSDVVEGGQYTITVTPYQLSDLSNGDQTYGLVVTGSFCLSSVSGIDSTPSFLTSHSCSSSSSLMDGEVLSVVWRSSSHPSTIAGFVASFTLITGFVLYMRAKGYIKR